MSNAVHHYANPYSLCTIVTHFEPSPAHIIFVPVFDNWLTGFSLHVSDRGEASFPDFYCAFYK